MVYSYTKFIIAAEISGTGRSTIYKWIKKGEQKKPREPFKTFAKKVREAESLGALDALNTIHDAVNNGDVKSAQWLLSRRHGYKVDAQHTIETETNQETKTAPKNYIEMLESQIADLKTSMDKARDSGSWQAYAALQRQLITMMQELKRAQVEDAENTGHERMTDEQLLSEIVNTIIQLPPILRQRVQSDLHSLAGSNVVALKKGI